MRLLWCDIETTGLDPLKTHVLEIAVSEADLLDPFNVKPLYHSIVFFPRRSGAKHQPDRDELWAAIDPFVVAMHTKNGLFDECVRMGKFLSTVENELLELVPMVDDKEERPVLAGSSIHFDHAYINVHMPLLAKRLSHRHYDISALKLFCQSMGMSKFLKGNAHRAKDDILESVAHGAACTQWLKENLR
jgi:oligoribonuclease